MKIVFLNGEFMPVHEAKVSVMDRGFLLGDGVYEVIPVYNRRLFRLQEHLNRLKDSLKAIKLKDPYSQAEWQSHLETLVEKNEGVHQSVYLQVSRGVSDTRNHLFPDVVIPGVYMMSTVLLPPDLPIPDCAITLKDIRWDYCHIKAITLLPNVLMKQQAKEAGCKESILIRDGLVTEGAASNVFVVKDGVVKTPPKSHHLLPGITRDIVVEVLTDSHIDIQEVDIAEDELFEADEIWITSSTMEICPIIKLNGKPVGTGEPGATWKQAIKLYQAFKNSL